MMAKREATMHKKALEDAETLIKENSNLSSQISRLEHTVEQQKADLSKQRLAAEREDELAEVWSNVSKFNNSKF